MTDARDLLAQGPFASSASAGEASAVSQGILSDAELQLLVTYIKTFKYRPAA